MLDMKWHWEKFLGTINVDDIPIQIVDDLMSSTEQDSDDTIIMTDGAQPVDVCFNPLNEQDRCTAALKFSLVITGATHPVVNIGVGNDYENSTHCHNKSSCQWCVSVQYICITFMWKRHIQCYNFACNLQLHRQPC